MVQIDMNHMVLLGGFARGGTSIIWNLLQSHHDAMGAGRETHELLVGSKEVEGTLTVRRRHLSHALRGAVPRPRVIGGHVFPNVAVFAASNLARRRIPRRLRPLVVDAIERGVVDTSNDPIRGVVRPGEPYARGATVRPVIKNINGIVHLHPSFLELFPGAVNVLLIRDPLALCESRVRRGSFQSIEKFGVVYRLIVEEMVRQVQTIPGTVVVDFDDFLRDPGSTIRALYAAVGLEGVPSHVRLKNKSFGTPAGERRTFGDGPRWSWIPFEELSSLIAGDVGDVQRSRLTAAQVDEFRRGAEDAIDMARSLSSQSLVSTYPTPDEQSTRSPATE